MPANYRKLMEGVPRPMEIMAHDERDQIPMGRRRVGRSEQSQRTEAYLAGVVSGDIPLNDDSAGVIREYLDAHHARQ